jgi:PAT family beta-lactamase induction signal transducer AmpG
LTDFRWRDEVRPLALMAVLGFSSGLPLALTGFTLRMWFTTDHIALGLIGFTANISLSYTLKFLWAPVFDERRPPLARLGRRRGWLLPVQLALAFSIAALGCADPGVAVWVSLALGAVVAFLSASQDILIDAWRIETFAPRAQGVALACYIWGYRAALLISGAGVIALSVQIGWRTCYELMAVLLLAGPVATWVAVEPVRAPHRAGGFKQAVLEPLKEFLSRQGVALVIAFIILFRLGEALGGVMLGPYYTHLGFNRVAIAVANGPTSLAATLGGAALGGFLVARFGVKRALLATGAFQTLVLFLYPALGLFPGHPDMLVVIAATESFAEGLADAAFLTYLSGLCNKEHTAAQYALLSSLAPLALHTIGGLSGILAGAIGFIPFYLVSAFAAVPAMLLMLVILRRDVALPTRAT